MLTVGILGGMGPMATADLFTKIIQCTPARTDQEHLKIIVYDNPQIPSRVDAILDGAESPENELIRSAQLLEKAGADILVMPCNTAHYWYNNIQSAIHIKLIHMIDNTAIYIKNQEITDFGKIMLFATSATVKTQMYQKAFAAQNVGLLVPDSEEQKIVAAAIDEVKSGQVEHNSHIQAIEKVIAKYQTQGVHSFIAGCTEIPLLFKHIHGDYRPVDPTELLAQEVVKRALDNTARKVS